MSLRAWHRRLVHSLSLGLLLWIPFELCASPTLYSFGPDAWGTGRVLTAIDGASGSVIGSPVTLGDGSTAFNGGLGYRATDQRFYAISNDSSGQASLVSFAASTPGTLTVLNASLGSGFHGGLAVGADGLYALGQAIDGTNLLYRMGFDGSALTQLALLDELHLAAGLTYNSDDGMLYAIGAGASFVPNRLTRISEGGAGWGATDLGAIGDGSVGFNGGLAYDAQADFFYALGNDSFAASQLYSFDIGGSLASLGAGPLGYGFVNAGLTLATEPGRPLPEPATLALLLAASLGLAASGHRARQRR